MPFYKDWRQKCQFYAACKHACRTFCYVSVTTYIDHARDYIRLCMSFTTFSCFVTGYYLMCLIHFAKTKYKNVSLMLLASMYARPFVVYLCLAIIWCVWSMLLWLSTKMYVLRCLQACIYAKPVVTCLWPPNIICVYTHAWFSFLMLLLTLKSPWVEIS